MKRIIAFTSVAFAASVAFGATSVHAELCTNASENCFAMPGLPTPEQPPADNGSEDTGTGNQDPEPILEEDNVPTEGNDLIGSAPDTETGDSNAGSGDPVEPPPAAPDTDGTEAGDNITGSAPDTETSSGSESSGTDTAAGDQTVPAAPDTETSTPEAQAEPTPVVVEAPAPVVETPAPVVVETPAPVVVETPAPVVVETPAPAVVEVSVTAVNHPLTGASTVVVAPSIEMAAPTEVTTSGNATANTNLLVKVGFSMAAAMVALSLAQSARRRVRVAKASFDAEAVSVDNVTTNNEVDHEIFSGEAFDAELAKLIEEESLETIMR